MQPVNDEPRPSYTLTAAAQAAGVSMVTLRKHMRRGTLEATPARTRHGEGWAIPADALAVFVAEHYGRALAPVPVAPSDPSASPVAHPSTAEHRETAAQLRRRLDATLEELGRYRALAEAGADTNARVEAGLRDALAELRHERDAERDRAAQAEAQAAQVAADLAALAAERDAAQAEAERLRSRGWFARTFGGRG